MAAPAPQPAQFITPQVGFTVEYGLPAGMRMPLGAWVRMLKQGDYIILTHAYRFINQSSIPVMALCVRYFAALSSANGKASRRWLFKWSPSFGT
jgi:hypothetical protein